MEIRLLEKNDLIAHERLASAAFICPAEEDAKAFPAPYMPGAFGEDGKLCADMEVYPRSCFFGNGSLSCAAVGGVASRPESRGKGAVSALFGALFEGSLVSVPFDICLLYPFSYAWYARLGFGAVGEKHGFSLSFRELSAVPRMNEAFSAEIYEGGDCAELLRIYNNAAKKYALCFERTDGEMFASSPYEEMKYTAVIRGKNGNGCAYATYTPDRRSDVLTVEECFAADKEAFIAMLGFFKGYAGNFTTLRFDGMPADFPIMHFVAEKGKCTRTVSPAGAARLLDAESVLKKAAYPEEKGSFTIGFTDDRIRKNNGVFGVVYEKGTARVTRTEKTADVLLSPAAAAKVLLEGVSGREEAEYISGAEIINANPDFFRAFGKKTVFFNDHF